ncbi:DMT family transporter [Neorhodopirellula pilleata]|uniref:EamA-like transporter family protein n=1 Tax=Neorhodopirellula pilleata TaxID=2714738 RepID=A0A5C6ADF1_9BACT|nr:DMT family transporter [Neorhodopirellula pilleata]TWT97436.1 EamA-like transporter family protein [Neorhodopirellula pilleata]
MIAVNALWGLSFPIVKALNLQVADHFDAPENGNGFGMLAGTSAWVIGVRFLLAMVLLLFFCRPLVASVRWPHLLSGAAIGAMFFFGLLLQVAGLASIPASRSGFLTSLVVVWTPVMATLWQRRLPRRKTIIGAAVSILGVSVLTGMITVEAGRIQVADDALSQWRLGDSLTSIAVFFFSIQIILVDSLGKRFESTAFTPSMFATTGLLAFTVFAGLHWIDLGPVSHSVGGPEGWLPMTFQLRFILPIIVLSLFSTLIAFFWMNRYQPVLTAGQAAVVYTLEPLFASTWAMFLPAWLSMLGQIRYENEIVTWQLIVGGAILILANGVALWPDRK